MSERIKVDLNLLRALPALEIDPTKKYLFLVDVTRFRIEDMWDPEFGVDALLIPVLPGLPVEIPEEAA